MGATQSAPADPEADRAVQDGDVDVGVIRYSDAAPE